MWTAKRIFKELIDPAERVDILESFWRHAEPHAKLAVLMQLAKAVHFREESIRKMPSRRKAEMLAARVTAPELEPYLEMALMLHHTRERSVMMAAFLDRWKVPHENGSIEAEDYTPPTAEAVREAVTALETEYPRGAIRLYLATAGLLMAGAWREATWPVVDGM